MQHICVYISLRFPLFFIIIIMAGAVAHHNIISSFPDAAPLDWPEPIQRVQILAESGLSVLPSQYIRPESERPCEKLVDPEVEIPQINLSGLEDENQRKFILAEIAHACEEWGFFQIVNHGVGLPLLQRMLLVAKQFFELPPDEKQAYANDPITYEGYGSRLGIQKGAILDWNDYFFLHILPSSTRDTTKWPTRPILWRDTVDEYSQQIAQLSQKLLAAISSTLDVRPSALYEAFGNKDTELSIRVNLYPPCPQPGLTLGLAPHSDPGGITILLQDESVDGLQVRHDGSWITVKPVRGGLIVNLGDQIQIMSNGIYKSVEHRAIAQREKQRVSIAAFCNPANDGLVAPLKELVKDGTSARYQAMTFKEYRSSIRRIGAKGKYTVESISTRG